MGAEMFSGDRVLMNPITGIADCCARTDKRPSDRRAAKSA